MLCTVCCALSVAYCQTVSCALHIACCTQCALPHCTLCMLHSACILTFYTVSCATYTDCVLCVLYTACWILHTAYTAHTVFSTAHCVLCTVYCTLLPVYCVLYTVCCARKEHTSRSMPRGAQAASRLPRGCFEVAVPRPARPACQARFSVRAFSPSKHTPVGVCF